MSVLIDQNTKVIVQGITGRDGSFHAQQMLEYGTNVVAGVTPGKGGQKEHGIEVYDSVAEAKEQKKANTAVIYVPAKFAKDAILEDINAGIDLIICITEGIPVLDMVEVRTAMKGKKIRLLGPNCPGVISPGKAKVGIMPGHIHKPGPIGVVSRSGTLTYEVVYNLTLSNIGQSSCVGLGGDPIIGTSTKQAVEFFMNDPETDAIVMIGEIGGNFEAEAARWVRAQGNPKPVVGFIAGQTAPPGRRMGHAGAIIGGADDTAEAKKKIMKECGIHVAESPADIGAVMAAAMN